MDRKVHIQTTKKNRQLSFMWVNKPFDCESDLPMYLTPFQTGGKRKYSRAKITTKITTFIFYLFHIHIKNGWKIV